jgi:hypothetical protein
MKLRSVVLGGAAGAALAIAEPLRAAEPDPHAGHVILQATPAAAAPAGADPHAGHVMPGATAPAADPHAGHVMPGVPAAHDHGQMLGALGPYSMMRDASGTSWQPESTPMHAVHGTYYGWSMMAHGYATLQYDHQGGPRGGNKIFGQSMAMLMGQHQAGPGHLTLRGMVSLDPIMGNEGYPLLLQTGETADGHTPLIDRQHPHDFVMELAAVYTVPIGPNASLFGYVGYPGELALGPPAFMHRASGIDIPEAPISHHWLDSTHITFGVLTGGVVVGNWKLEGSLFTGREPDQHRWGFDRPRLDSQSVRLSWNPTPNWALQVSYGAIEEPEILEPGIDQRRVTASASYNRPLMGGNWQLTFAWGQNRLDPGPTLSAFLVESAFTTGPHTFFGRAEHTEKNELFDHHDPLHGQIFDVGKLSFGYLHDIFVAEHVSLGLGAMGSLYALPDSLEPFYGSPTSFMLFARLRLE